MFDKRLDEEVAEFLVSALVVQGAGTARFPPSTCCGRLPPDDAQLACPLPISRESSRLSCSNFDRRSETMVTSYGLCRLSCIRGFDIPVGIRVADRLNGGMGMRIMKDIVRLGGLEPAIGSNLAPLAPSEIADFEKLISSRLPDAYRDFLLCFGAVRFCGIVQIDNLVSRESQRFAAFVGTFYGGSRSAPFDIVSIFDAYSGRMPSEIVPIAEDGSGNQFCIGIGDVAGTVFFWDHHDERDPRDYVEEGLPVPDGLMWGNVMAIAPSFEGFVSALSVSDLQ